MDTEFNQPDMNPLDKLHESLPTQVDEVIPLDSHSSVSTPVMATGWASMATSTSLPQAPPPDHNNTNQTTNRRHASIDDTRIHTNHQPHIGPLSVTHTLSPSSLSPLSVSGAVLRELLLRQLEAAKEENRTFYIHSARKMIQMQAQIDELTRENVALIRSLAPQTLQW